VIRAKITSLLNDFHSCRDQCRTVSHPQDYLQSSRPTCVTSHSRQHPLLRQFYGGNPTTNFVTHPVYVVFLGRSTAKAAPNENRQGTEKEAHVLVPYAKKIEDDARCETISGKRDIGLRKKRGIQSKSIGLSPSPPPTPVENTKQYICTSKT
jgi:hypothetical protein